MDNKNLFLENKYLLIENILKNPLRDIVTQYSLFDEIQDYRPDPSQVPGAHAKYADPLMESILIYLHSIIEKQIGISLYPTYSFYRVYRNGDILKPHVDRPSCEISATVCFNYSYDKSEYSWPIIMDNNKIEMNPGDIVIYRGIDLEHSRDKFSPPGNDWHVQGFFHYVDANGPYSNYKFDNRESIGLISSSSNNKGYIQYI